MSIIYYSEEEDNNKEESINKYKELFSEYKNQKPSLSDALEQMFLSASANKNKSYDLTKDILLKCESKINDNFDEISKKYPNITKNDAYIICSYTCESKDKKFSPYRILNQNLVSDDRKKGIKNISKYLYIFLNSLRKLEIYIPSNKYLYRCITSQVKLSPDPFNDKFIPYIIGNQKTFWGFTSTSSNVKMTYNFLKEEQTIKTGTIFVLGGYIWGYDITLFNYFNEKEILLEPERKFKIDNILPPINGIITINCNILKTPLILDDNNISEKIYNKLNINNYNENNNNKYNYICEIKMEINEDGKYKYISSMGLLCNIKDKNMKAIITYSNIINLDILNKENKLIYFKNNKEKKEIDLKKSRFKYVYDDITIIEILENEEDINNYIEIDDYIKSNDYKDEEIILIEYNKNNKIKYIDDKIKENNNDNFICYNNNNIKEGIIILKNNLKLIGIINENNKLSMNKILNKINYMKGIYEIKKEDIGKDIQIIQGIYDSKLIIEGEIKKYIFRHKFKIEGLYQIYIISDNILTNMRYMFYECSRLKELNLSSFNTNQVTDMSYMFRGCSGLKELNLSSFNTNQVTNMSCMFSKCLLLKKLNCTDNKIMKQFKDDKISCCIAF